MELVIISGKGGTGKTTITAGFSSLSDSSHIKADCDVDAANLHLMFDYQIESRVNFVGAKLAAIDLESCIGCNLCMHYCRFNAIDKTIENKVVVNPLKCEGCGACKVVCKHHAVSLNDEITGETRKYKTKVGTLTGASMIPGAEGSGKLVTQVRKMAKHYSDGKEANILIDGSPGVGCAVMASVTGCKYGIIVTEPTLSGYEDFVRVHELLKFFNIGALAIINKFDINDKMTKKIETYCLGNDIQCLGKVPFDRKVENSINEGKPIVEYDDSIAGKAIKEMWSRFIEFCFKAEEGSKI